MKLIETKFLDRNVVYMIYDNDFTVMYKQNKQYWFYQDKYIETIKNKNDIAKYLQLKTFW